MELVIPKWSALRNFGAAADCLGTGSWLMVVHLRFETTRVATKAAGASGDRPLGYVSQCAGGGCWRAQSLQWAWGVE